MSDPTSPQQPYQQPYQQQPYQQQPYQQQQSYQQQPWPQQPVEPASPYGGGTPPGDTPYGGGTPPGPPRRRRWIIPTVLAVLVAAGIVTAVMVLDDSHGTAGGTALTGEDSGIAACKAIAEDKTLAGDNNDDELTEAEYKQIRKQFADSKDAAIRDNGTKIIDITWQLQGMSEDQAVAAIDKLGDLVTAYGGLAAGCAAQGIELPALDAN